MKTTDKNLFFVFVFLLLACLATRPAFNCMQKLLPKNCQNFHVTRGFKLSDLMPDFVSRYEKKNLRKCLEFNKQALALNREEENKKSATWIYWAYATA